MLLPFFVARKYFLSGKNKTMINVLSIISMLTLAVGVIGLFGILSAFNGLSGLIQGVHHTFDSEIVIVPKKGKVFPVDSLFISRIEQVEGVALVTEIIEDDAFMHYRDLDKVVRVKGVGDNFWKQNGMADKLVSGDTSFWRKEIPQAIFGRGIQYELMISLGNHLQPLQIWYPKREKKYIRQDEKSFNRLHLSAGGVFELERQYDDKYVFVPLSEAQYLFEYDNERSALEIKTISGADLDDVKENLQEELGEEFLVQMGNERHASLFKAIKIEKFVSFLILSFVLAIASLNTFLTVTMIVISKRKEIAVLKSMGATKAHIRRIFLAEGFLIGLVGTTLGLFIGVSICLLQEHYGFYKMNVQTAITDAFPFKVEWFDILTTGSITLFVTLLVSIQPAIKASKVDVAKHL